jgi:hypothetical protein
MLCLRNKMSKLPISVDLISVALSGVLPPAKLLKQLPQRGNC